MTDARSTLIAVTTAALLTSLPACSTEAPAITDDAGTPEPVGKADGVDDALPVKTPKRVILLVGDGMGIAAVTGAAHAADERLAMLSMPHVGFMTTHEHEFVTTDSAASATAMATGSKTHFEGVGVAPGTTADDEHDEDQQLVSIIDAAKSAGWRTGLISTTSIVDATPAAFAAHRAKRKSKDGIAEDIRNSGVDVLLGGGRKFFDDRGDGQNLLNQMRDKDGYSIAKTATGLKRASGSKTRVVGLLHDKDMPDVRSGDRAMPLSGMVGEALEILDTENDAGFFLMVEGAQIDRREHELDAEGAVAEALDFDAAIAVALEYARGRDDTLVVVTADHETGGLVIADPDATAPHIQALGGRDEALELAASGGFGSFAPAFVNIDLGDARLSGESSDSTLLATFGDMSLASRPFWNGPTFAFRAAHTPVMVPLFAEGPGAQFVARTHDNAELGQRLRLLAEAAAEDTAEPAEPAEPDTTAPKHVVVVVSDLVGLAALTAAHYQSGQLRTTQLPVRGLMAPVADDAFVPDAAAAASALATGARTSMGAIGGGNDVELTTLLELAERNGRRTGLVSTGRLTDVRAASFYAHVNAGDDTNLADAAVGFEPTSDGLDIVFAGGADAFTDAQLQAWAERDAVVTTEWTDAAVADEGPDVRLVARGVVSDDEGDNGPTLAEMTTVAMDGLVDDPDGSVLLVVASGATAVAAQHGDGQALVEAIQALDAAVAAALEIAAERDDTAVVVTSLRDATTSVLDNHYGFHKKHCGITSRCDGPETLMELAVAIGAFPRSMGMNDDELQGDFGVPRLFVQSSWLTFRAHAADGVAEVASAHFTPVFASGPGTSALGGFHTAPELGQVLQSWIE